MWDIFAKNYGIYSVKSMGYNGPKFWDMLVKIVGYILENYGIFWSIGYIKRKVRDILGK